MNIISTSYNIINELLLLKFNFLISIATLRLAHLFIKYYLYL